MSERHSIFAFIAVLLAICYLATIAAWLASAGRYAEALGFGGITTGLVGVIGTFRPRTGSDPSQEKTTQDAIAKIPPTTEPAP